MASGAPILESPPTSPRLIHQNASQLPITSSTYNDSGRESKAVQVPRSASYTYLPQVAIQSSITAAATDPAIKRTFSEEVLTAHLDGHDGDPRYNGTPDPSQNRKNPTAKERLMRRKPAASRENPEITISEFTLSRDAEVGNISYELKTAKEPIREGRLQDKSRNLPGSLSSLAKQPWVSSSRSPSPNNGEGDDSSKEGTDSTARSSVSSSSPKKSLLLRRNTDKPTKKDSTEVPKKISRKGTLLSKKAKRPLSTYLKGPALNGPASDVESAPAIPKSFSTDRLPSLLGFHTSSEQIPPVPRSLSSDRSQTAGLELPRKKDELWNVFRGLEGEYQKFQAKSSALKANVVRSSLLPFLRNDAQRPSIRTLRPEDLDRRVNVLNKWWTGLLEMVNGRNSQSISGTDRPVLLEGMAGIMSRPEWRLGPSPFAPLNERGTKPTWSSRSSTSLESTASEFLAESVYHNVRNTFVQNLLAQTSFVVNKMSLRSAPASLVSFCGKALAFAFFFCPGIADILVRLWALSADTLRRVLQEYGINRTSNLKAVSEFIVPGFPPCLQSLGFSAFPAMVRYLRRRTPHPFGTAKIRWDGPWTGRWSGRDSDLFFVFAKSFHILTAEFLPNKAGVLERACAPAFLLVDTQILALLDSTIHRHLGHPAAELSNGPSSITFDDVLSSADASAAALPVPPTNVVRLMAENRLIMLLRDFLFQEQSNCNNATQVFAEAFNAILKAAVRKVSLFNHSACFTLCDFMEEAITILVRYQPREINAQTLFDWPFWFDVCKQLTESQNSMTEIRLFAFIYSIWGIIADDEERKGDLCLGWLLSERSFERHFNHWCPMVRAYYMRLLCWRLARFDGDESELNLAILQALSDRLKSTWSHFLFLKNKSEEEGSIPPSTAPCNPAPGRRLLIIRNDNQIPPGNLFLSFDGIVPPSFSTHATSYKRHLSLNSSNRSDAGEKEIDAETAEWQVCEDLPSAGRKRWGLLRNIMPFSHSSNDRTKPKNTKAMPSKATVSLKDLPKDSPDTNGSPIPLDSVDGLNRSGHKDSNIHFSGQAPFQHLCYSFKFSLEWVERPQHASKDRRLYPPRLPMPAQLYLQSRRAVPYDVTPKKPPPETASSSKYSGRALAEWALIVIECQNFFERRKNEGVPGNKWIETPTLGVESFRRPG
ncbi:MAG: hypothetical protein M1835_004817 [Candelina submexicana]|nr:MAG: hypothetical protein M1835_004817 [Candelina submexicana]